MTSLEKNILDLIEAGQKYNLIEGRFVDEYKPFVRAFAGRVRDVLKTKNPLHMSCLVFDIDKVLGIINPELTKEIAWFNALSKAIKLWVNDRVITYNILGIKNHNQ